MAVRISSPIVVILAISALIALASACSEPSWEDPLQPHVTWVLESINGNPAIREAPISLTISDDWVGGEDGCNSYDFRGDNRFPFVPITSHPDSSFMEGEFSGGRIGGTAVFCEGIDGIMDQADAYTRTLAEGRTFRIQDDQLEIFDEEGQATLVFVRQPPFPGHQPDLVGTQWRMMDERVPIILAFVDSKTAVGLRECSAWKAKYSTSDRLLKFHSVDWLELHRSCSKNDWFGSYWTAYDRSVRGAEHYSVIQEGGSEKLMVGTRLGESFTFAPLSELTFNWEHEQGSLRDKEWLLWNIVDLTSDVPRSVRAIFQEVRPEPPVNITFRETQVSGSAGCNTYEASLGVTDDEIVIGSPTISDLSCDDLRGFHTIMKQEERYLSLLPQMTRMGTYGDRLIMSDGQDIYLLFDAE